MKYRFHTSVKYFSPDEKKHIDEFMENEPVTGHTYVKETGESRKCAKVAYPTGLITKLTVWGPRPLPKNEYEVVSNERPYHTPCATVEESREAKINYINADGTWDTCYSKDWLAWYKKGKTTVVEPEPTPENPMAKLPPETLARLHGVKLEKKEQFTDLSKSAKK